MLFILAAQKHYTIDVVIGFWVTYKIYVEFHEALEDSTLKRFSTARSFVMPLGGGQVTNTFEWPKMSIQKLKSCYTGLGFSHTTGNYIKHNVLHYRI